MYTGFKACITIAVYCSIIHIRGVGVLLLDRNLDPKANSVIDKLTP